MPRVFSGQYVRLKLSYNQENDEGLILATYAVDVTRCYLFVHKGSPRLIFEMMLTDRSIIVEYDFVEQRMVSPEDGSFFFLDIRFLEIGKNEFALIGTLWNSLEDVYFDVMGRFKGHLPKGISFTSIP